MYSLVFTPGAFRIFKKFTSALKREIIKQAEKLRKDPLKGELLRGKFKNYQSLHFNYKGTSYRIIYHLNVSGKKIEICLAHKRENIYRRLEKMGL